MGREEGTFNQRFYRPRQEKWGEREEEQGEHEVQEEEEEACSGQGVVSSRWCVPYEFSLFHVKDNKRILVFKDHSSSNSDSSSGHGHGDGQGPTSITHLSASMALHSIHRVASSAKQRTKESIRRVFSSYSTVQPVAVSDDGGESNSSNTGAAAGGGTDSPRDRTDDTVERFESDAERKRNNSKGGRTTWTETSSSSDFEATDDEGYVTANDEDDDVGNSIASEGEGWDFEDHNQIHEGSEKRRIPNGVQEESVSGQPQQQQEWDLQVSGSGKQGNMKREFHSALDLESLNTIHKLRTAVLKLDSDERLGKVDDATFLRFLIARNMDIKRASDMFIKDWRWRKDVAPLGYMPTDAVASQLKAEKAFLQGVDRRGRPLLILLGSKHYAKGRDMEEFKNYCFYCIEKVVASIPEGKDKFVTVIDIGGTAYKNMDIGATKLMVDLLQAHYPERMAQLFVIHSSPMIQWPYKFVEPAIDIKTRKKILFVGDENLETLMEDEIGAECVPKAYGGDAEFIPIQYAKVDSSTYPSRAVAVREE